MSLLGTADIRSLNKRLGAPGRLSIILAVVAVIAVLVSFRGLGRALFTPSAKEVKNLMDERVKQLAADYTKSLDMQVAQFNGRSVFFTPSAPLPKPVDPPPVTVVETPKVVEPTKPTSYGGPKLIGMVNGAVWFDDGQKLESGASGKDGLKVKSVRAPWDAMVEWKETEFKVSLFDRDKVINPPPPPPKEEAKEPLKTAAKEPSDEAKGATHAEPTVEETTPAKPESAKPTEPVGPPETPKPADPPKPDGAAKPADQPKPSEQPKTDPDTQEKPAGQGPTEGNE